MPAEQTSQIGDVPLAWYRDLAHEGYNVDGRRLSKSVETDSLSNLLSNIDDRSAWRRISDALSGGHIKLSKSDVLLLQRIQAGWLPSDSLEHTWEWDSSTNTDRVASSTEPKRRFLPSQGEAKAVARLVRVLRRTFQTGQPAIEHAPHDYDIWAAPPSEQPNTLGRIRARKPSLPANELSFNPPVEYAEYAKMNISNKSASRLRQMCSYECFTQERFERCLDLYLCPRSHREKTDISPEELLPKLPMPKQLKPFPEIFTQRFLQQRETIDCFSVNCSGEWLAMCTSSGSLLIWDVHTGKNIYHFDFNTKLGSVHWHPTRTRVLVVTMGTCAVVIRSLASFDPGQLRALKSRQESSEQPVWNCSKAVSVIQHALTVREVAWHRKGRYFATIFGERGITVHDLDFKCSQQPFAKYDSRVMSVSFHPTEPFFFICSPRQVRMYNLKTQELKRKFSNGMTNNMCMCISSSGSSLLVGERSGKTLWFDVESDGESKAIAVRGASVLSVTCHNSYPLIATAAQDGKITVFHMSEPSDSVADPMFVPVNVIQNSHLELARCLDVQFHPRQPWLFMKREPQSLDLYTQK